MKRHCVILAFLWMVSSATLALAQTSKSVAVAAGDLTDAIESLAKQCDVDVVYSSGLVRGQTTQGLTGTFKPTEAFQKLLEGTSLGVREEGGALLITAVPDVVSPDLRVDLPAVPGAQRSTEQPIDEVTVEAARKERLSVLRARLDSLEDEFYKAYNKVNTIPDYDVKCTRAWGRVRECRLALKQTCSGSASLPSFSTSPEVCTIWWPPVDYRQHMAEVLAQHPELLELLQERRSLAAHYEAVRREKFQGKIFVWD